MKNFAVDTQLETIELGNDSLQFHEMVKMVDGKLMTVNGNTIIINSLIQDRLSVSDDGTTLLFDGAPIKAELSAAEILADLPQA